MSQEYQNALPKDTILDTYRIEKVLGVGGFGVTYLAYELNLGKAYAIKELMPEGIAVRKAGETSVIARSTSDQDDFKATRERFISEARVLAAIEHPAVVAVHRLLEAHGTCYMVMDYVKGDTLDGYLKKQKGRIKDRAELDNLFLPILDGLEVLHGQELVHRDIKPGNIMVTPDNKPVLLDFGAVCAVQNKTITVTQMVSAGYSPFEQYTTKARQGPYTDIYAMGATMVRCIAGKKPDDASDRVYGDSYTPLAENEQYLEIYGEPMLSAIDAAMEMDPASRPQTVAEWREMMIQSDSRPIIVPPTEVVKPVYPPTPPEGRDPFAQPVALAAKIIDLPDGVSPERREVGGKKPIAPKGGRVGVKKNHLPAVIASAAVLIGIVIVLFWQPWASKKLSRVDDVKAKGLQSDTANDEEGNKATKAQQQALDAAIVLFKEGEPLPKNFFDKVSKDDLQSAAVDGDARAQFLWGLANDSYFGLLDDQSEAIEWYKRAATGGDIYGMRHLAFAYRDGNGTSQSYQRALEWYEKAANQGDYKAMGALGNFYDPDIPKYKNVVRQSYAKAVDWYRKAANAGSASGMRNLAFAYREGKGVSKDYQKAFEWFEKAAKRGDHKAMGALAFFYDPDMPKYKNVVRQSYVKALEWYEKAANQGDSKAMAIVGNFYDPDMPKYKNVVRQSYVKAVECYRKAANAGRASSMRNMGYAYRLGKGVPQNDQKAFEWYEKAALAGDRNSMLKVADAYSEGKGVRRDGLKAKQWLEKAKATE